MGLRISVKYFLRLAFLAWSTDPVYIHMKHITLEVGLNEFRSKSTLVLSATANNPEQHPILIGSMAAFARSQVAAYPIPAPHQTCTDMLVSQQDVKRSTNTISRSLETISDRLLVFHWLLSAGVPVKDAHLTSLSRFRSS